MTRVANLLSMLAATAVLAACGKPVPPDKIDYVGEWEHPTMYLLITQDGSVKYKRTRPGQKTSVDGPLRAFHGDNFEVGVGPLNTMFIVSEPPRQRDGTWTMTVDGVQLTRTSTLR